jgi:hypothetical protein
VTMEFPDLQGLVRTARAARGVTHGAGQHLGRRHRLRPFDLGIDIVMQALTKVPFGRRRRADGFGHHARRGAARTHQAHPHAPGPGRGANDAELVLRSLPTMPLRYHAQDAAGRAAGHLAGHAARGARVCCTRRWKARRGTRTGAPLHGAAGLFSVMFDARFSAAQVDAFVDALRLFRIGYSWAGPVSLAVPYDLAGDARTPCAAAICRAPGALLDRAWRPPPTCRPIWNRRSLLAPLMARRPRRRGRRGRGRLAGPRHLVPHQAALLALPVASASRCGACRARLALGQRDLGLHAAALVVQVQRHQGEALLLDLADQAPDLALCISSFLVRSASG